MSMSRNDQLSEHQKDPESSNRPLPAPSNSSQSAPVIHNDFSINLTVNIGPTTSSEDKDQTVRKAFDLIGQQIKELCDEKKRRSSKRRSRRTSSYAFSREVDAVPPTPELSESSKETSGEKTDPVPSTTPAESKRKSTGSSEYQNLSTIHEATNTPAPTRKRRCRFVPNLKAVPEEDLPKPKFAADRKRRDYVLLGELNSIELIEEKE